MKLTIGNYEVDIKVKGYLSDRANAEDAKYFLNKLSSTFYQASKQSESEGWKYRAGDEQEMADQIYKFLCEKGFYDDIHKNAKKGKKSA